MFLHDIAGEPVKDRLISYLMRGTHYGYLQYVMYTTCTELLKCISIDISVHVLYREVLLYLQA
jgi:hypothetical protein